MACKLLQSFGLEQQAAHLGDKRNISGISNDID
jgi:hypothetical protein